MTAAEAARQLGISRQRLYQWLRAGQVPGPSKRGNHRLPDSWSAADVERARLAKRANVRPRAGRPPGTCKAVNRRLVARLRAHGATWRAIAARLGCCIPVARRALQQPNKASQNPRF